MFSSLGLKSIHVRRAAWPTMKDKHFAAEQKKAASLGFHVMLRMTVAAALCMPELSLPYRWEQIILTALQGLGG